MDSIDPPKTSTRMTFGRFALITIGTSLLLALYVESVMKGEKFDMFMAGVVFSYIIFPAGGTLAIVALSLLVRRALRGTSSWPYWCGSVVFVLVSLVMVLASLSMGSQTGRVDSNPSGVEQDADRR